MSRLKLSTTWFDAELLSFYRNTSRCRDERDVVDWMLEESSS